MTYNDGRDDDPSAGRTTIFVVVLAIAVFVAVVLCMLGLWPS